MQEGLGFVLKIHSRKYRLAIATSRWFDQLDHTIILLKNRGMALGELTFAGRPWGPHVDFFGQGEEGNDFSNRR
jgi:hypothetical protein